MPAAWAALLVLARAKPRLILTLCSGRERFHAGEEFVMGRVRGFEKSAESRAYLSMGRAEMCLSSMCAILNATRPEPGKYDVAALVDDATPAEVLAGYARNGVTIVPMHTRVNPPAHYLGPHTRRGPSLGDLGPKIAESMRDAERRVGWKLKAATLRAADATSRGLPTLYHVPYGIYRLWAWAMVEYREVLYVDPDIWLVTSASHFFNELTRSKAVRARAARAAGKPPDTRPALLVSQRPEQQYLNFGFWVLEPSVKVFHHIMRAWVRGNHSYFPLFDEQYLMRDIAYKHSLIQLHRMNKCYNNKFDLVSGCAGRPRLLWHRVPRTEARRVRALHDAAKAGTCRDSTGLRARSFSG